MSKQRVPGRPQGASLPDKRFQRRAIVARKERKRRSHDARLEIGIIGFTKWIAQRERHEEGARRSRFFSYFA